MRGKRAVSGLLAASVMVISAVMIPVALAEPPPLKEAGEHTTWVFCHRTGSESNPYVVIATDDAAWAEAHVHGSDPAHPVLDGRDDIFIGILGQNGLTDKKQAEDICDGKNPPPPPK